MGRPGRAAGPSCPTYPCAWCSSRRLSLLPARSSWQAMDREVYKAAAATIARQGTNAISPAPLSRVHAGEQSDIRSARAAIGWRRLLLRKSASPVTRRSASEWRPDRAIMAYSQAHAENVTRSTRASMHPRVAGPPDVQPRQRQLLGWTASTKPWRARVATSEEPGRMRPPGCSISVSITRAARAATAIRTATRELATASRATRCRAGDAIALTFDHDRDSEFPSWASTPSSTARSVTRDRRQTARSRSGCSMSARPARIAMSTLIADSSQPHAINAIRSRAGPAAGSRNSTVPPRLSRSKANTRTCGVSSAIVSPKAVPDWRTRDSSALAETAGLATPILTPAK